MMPNSSPSAITVPMMALLGGIFFSAFLLEDLAASGEQNWSDMEMALIFRYVVAMIFGGALAGVLLSGIYGRAGVLGWILAFSGGVCAALIAGILGSAAGLLPNLLSDGWQSTDLISIAFGALVAPLAAATHPWLLLVWVIIVAATHVLCRRKRQHSQLKV